MDALTFQTQLEQLLEEDRKLSSKEPGNQSFMIRIGAYLLQGQEHLLSEEYQGALEHCNVTPEMAAFAIETCKSFAELNRHFEAVKAHEGDHAWIMRYMQEEMPAPDMDPEEWMKQQRQKFGLPEGEA